MSSDRGAETATARTFGQSRLMPALGIVLNAAIVATLVPDVVDPDRFNSWLLTGGILAVLFLVDGLVGRYERGPQLDGLPLRVHAVAALSGLWTGGLALIDPAATGVDEFAYMTVLIVMGTVLRIMLYSSLGLFRLILLFTMLSTLIAGLAVAGQWPFVAAMAAVTVAATRIAVVNHRDGLELHALRLESATREREAAWLAHHDSLTGLLNRRGLDARSEELDIGYCLFLDLDHFKIVNDSHGHEIGDRVLTEVGRRVTEVVGNRGVAARVGGDEFLVLLAAGHDGDVIGSELLRSVRHPIDVAAVEPIVVSASAGGAAVRAGFDLTAIVRRSDQALYAAKETGRDRLVDGDSR